MRIFKRQIWYDSNGKKFNENEVPDHMVKVFNDFKKEHASMFKKLNPLKHLTTTGKSVLFILLLIIIIVGAKYAGL